MAELDSDKVGLSAPVETADIADNAVDDAKLRDSAGFSVVGKATTGTGDPADIVAGDEVVLGRTAAGNLSFAQVATGQIANNAVDDAKLRDSAALSVIGRSANSTGDPADIAAGTDHYILRRSGTTIGFGDKSLVGFNLRVSHTGVTAETVLRTITIPANRLGANGGFRWTAFGLIGGVNDVKTVRVRLGGIGGTILATVIRAAGDTFNWASRGESFNTAATNAQRVASFETTDSSDGIIHVPTTAAKDSTAALDLVVTGELANAGDTITVDAFAIEFLQVVAP